MRLITIPLLTLLLISISCSSAGATCACSKGGGGASYDYLGDRAFNMDLESFDEFAGPVLNDAMASSTEPDPSGAVSELMLDLDDNKHVDLQLFKAEEGFFGKGNLTDQNGREERRLRRDRSGWKNRVWKVKGRQF